MKVILCNRDRHRQVGVVVIMLLTLVVVVAMPSHSKWSSVFRNLSLPLLKMFSSRQLKKIPSRFTRCKLNKDLFNFSKV